MKKRSTATYTLLMIIGVLILVNVLAYKFFFRLDFTEDKQYTLHKATKNILKNLEEPVTVKAYFSEDLPPHIEKIRKDFMNKLKEYERRSKGMVIYEFLNPSENKEIEKEAMQNQIQPVVINVQKKDEVKQQKAYLGAVIQLGEKKDVIPAIVGNNSMEYMLSKSIKKLSVIDKPFIGIIQGHGEPGIQEMPQAMQELTVLYNIEPVSMSDTGPTDFSRYKTLALINPKDTIPAFHLQQLDQYMSQGKNLFVAFNRVDGDFEQAPLGKGIFCGLSPWLNNKGINVGQNFVMDANCAAITVQQSTGTFRYQQQINFPYFPIAQNFSKHPVVQGLETVIFQFASTINFSGDSSIIYTPLVKSSKKSATQTVPTYFNVQKNWTGNDFPLSDLVMAAAFSGKLTNGQPSKMVVVSNGAFAINGSGRQAQQINVDNISLLTNAIDWLSDDTGLIELRTKGITSRPLKDMEDGKRLRIKLINLLLPIISIVIIGVVIMQMNKKKRIKRMEVGHV